MIQNYLLIRIATNTVDNVCLWDGNQDTWAPPSGYFALVQATTSSLLWLYDETAQDFVLTDVVGQGQIGFSWNGTACVTNAPKPPKPAPQQP